MPPSYRNPVPQTLIQVMPAGLRGQEASDGARLLVLQRELAEFDQKCNFI
jgi:hypothetical protein